MKPHQPESPSHSLRFPKPCSAAGTGLLRGLNRFGRSFLQDGRWLVTLDEEKILEESRRVTGLDDFGDSLFREPLAILLRSFEEDAELNVLGRITVHSQLLRILCNRLRMVQDRKRFPEIAQQVIRRPLFITGLPRSGTSFLHALLAQDPRCRAPQVWEVMHPSPPPTAADYRSDPRIRHAEKELRWIDVLMPGFETCHFIDARAPQECIAITDHSFLSYLFESMYFVTSYRSWHDRQDKIAAYRFHRQFLQQLQCHCPGSHWVLKAPSHLMALEALLQVYPDADIVLTHRDPLKVIPSTASFAEILRAPFTNRCVRRDLGPEVSRRWADSARLVTRFRQEHPELRQRFLDVAYPELIRDPMLVVRRLYRHFGRELTPAAERLMLLFLKRQTKDKNGVHRYSLEEFGLDPGTELGHFQEYMDYFNVVPEP